jgi:hypothetical protein
MTPVSKKALEFVGLINRTIYTNFYNSDEDQAEEAYGLEIAPYGMIEMGNRVFFCSRNRLYGYYVGLIIDDKIIPLRSVRFIEEVFQVHDLLSEQDFKSLTQWGW